MKNLTSEKMAEVMARGTVIGVGLLMNVALGLRGMSILFNMLF